MSDVELINVTKRYGDSVAVRDISFTVPAGSFFSLLGPSGCGKSTTLRMIAGLEEVDEGTLLVGGRDMTDVPANRRPTNMVFQRWALFPHMTLYENVAFGLQMEGVKGPEVKKRVTEALAMVGLEHRMTDKPGRLSGGQMQRVALVRALVKRPQVLLLDEPLGALDLKLRLQLQRELKTIQREVGITFVYVTHDQGEALVMSDQIAVMNDGGIEQLGPPRDIYDKPRSPFVADFIGGSNFIAVDILERNEAGLAVGQGPLAFRAEPLNEPSGNSGIACVRYERIKLGEFASGLPSTWTAKVLDVAFVGAVVQYTLQPENGGPELIAQVPYDSIHPVYAVGETVPFGWEESAAGFLNGSVSAEGMEAA